MLAPLQLLRPLSRPLFVAAAGGIVALVSSVASGTSSSGTTSSAIDTSGANFLVVIVCSYAASGEPTLADSKGNAWTGQTARFASIPRIRLFYCAVPTVGTGHTFSVSGAASYGTLSVAAFSGLSSSPADQQAGATSASASIQPGSITPSAGGALLVSGFSYNQSAATSSVDSGFTIAGRVDPLAGSNFGCALAWKLQAAAAAVNPTWTASGVEVSGVAAVIADFKPV